MYTESTVQTAIFVLAAVLGAGLGLLYDVFRFLRRLFMMKAVATALTDIVYCALATFGLFIFTVIIGKGQLRGFILIGFLGGAALYFLGPSRLVMRGFKILDTGIKKAGKRFKKSFCKLSCKVKRLFSRIFIHNARKSIDI